MVSKKISYGGILTALCCVILYIASILPTSKLFFYGVSSIFTVIILLKFGHEFSWLFYLSTSILSFIVIPQKIDIIPYIVFFGLYGIIKYYIEAIDNLIIEALLKGLFFAAIVAGYIFIYEKIFLLKIVTKVPIYFVGIAALIMFYIYDYAFSRFISYYNYKVN